jgi:hypothetical protein
LGLSFVRLRTRRRVSLAAIVISVFQILIRLGVLPHP